MIVNNIYYFQKQNSKKNDTNFFCAIFSEKVGVVFFTIFTHCENGKTASIHRT